MPAAENGDRILVAVQGDCAFVQVCGRGSFKNAPAVKRFGLSAIEQDCRFFVLDMAACTGMDSTFMGVLAGLALRLRETAGGRGRLMAINLTAKTESLLDTLGLTRLMDTYQAGVDPEALKAGMQEGLRLDSLPAGGEDRKALVETMLSAHQELSGLSADNRLRFKDVLAYLEQDLKQIEG